MKIEDLKEEIQNITESRRTSHGSIRHKLEDIIIIGLCTVICRGEDYSDMETFGINRKECRTNPQAKEDYNKPKMS